MNKISVEVQAEYLSDQSRPDQNQFVWAYHIRIRNEGHEAAQLISRYWHIEDAKQQVQEVQGEGVVGEQPALGKGESYSYTSGCVLETSSGIMRGHYIMRRLSDAEEFKADIPAFSLHIPGSLH
jgi:ApaG protein